MDAKNKSRPSISVKIGGRKLRMYKPKEAQYLALTMAESTLLPEADRLAAMGDMFLSLFDEGPDRSWVLRQMASGQHSLEDFMATLKRAATAKADVPDQSAAEPDDVVDEG